MDKITEVFLNWQVLLLSFVVFAVLGVLRALGTKKDPKTGEAIGGWAENTWFRRFLPIYPYCLSIGLVFVPGVPLPAIVGKTLAVKLFFAVYAGWLSDKVYQIIKHYLDERGIHIDDLATKAADKLTKEMEIKAPDPAPVAAPEPTPAPAPVASEDPTPKEPTP